jgi:hypothetical protein
MYHYQLIRPRLRQPHLAGPAENLAHAGVAAGALEYGELFGLRVEAQHGVGAEIWIPAPAYTLPGQAPAGMTKKEITHVFSFSASLIFPLPGLLNLRDPRAGCVNVRTSGPTPCGVT